MTQPSARLYVNNVGWVTGVEVFVDGEWQPALYEHVNQNAVEAELEPLFQVAGLSEEEWEDSYGDYRMEREGLL